MKTLNDYMAISYRMKIDQFRLEKAFLELKNTDKTVLESSQEAGFDNLSNFNRLFKKQFLMTPGGAADLLILHSDFDYSFILSISVRFTPKDVNSAFNDV